MYILYKEIRFTHRGHSLLLLGWAIRLIDAVYASCTEHMWTKCRGFSLKCDGT